MKCCKCGSSNLAIVPSGPHQKLVCKDCAAFQKFMSKTQASIFTQIDFDNLSEKSPLKIWTAQMSKVKGKNWPVLDITVKGNHKVGRFFAPSWDMVSNYKNNTISEKEYEKQYRKMMRLSYTEHRDAWNKVLELKEIVLICFCPSDSFCHRHLLAKYLVKLGAIYNGEL